MAISEINPTAVKIDKLIARVADGDIKIPAFQRRFVWDQEQVIELLDSIYRDYPLLSVKNIVYGVGGRSVGNIESTYVAGRLQFSVVRIPKQKASNRFVTVTTGTS